MGVASDNSEISDNKITLPLNAREYIDNQNNNSLSFKLYHFPEDAHILPVQLKFHMPNHSQQNLRRERNSGISFVPSTKIPKLSSLSLPHANIDSQDEIFLQPNVNNDLLNEIQADNTIIQDDNHTTVQDNKHQEQRGKSSKKNGKKNRKKNIKIKYWIIY
ncbi:unnamed protein product [Rhizophagus irregularis]|uniref:Uncharacterized protein n=1 Tax=Rhizophagus irregularis TaxID=588596 RepID=A0A2N1MRW5_9GLOM|nr:hypothetical protein RhiirC2_787595 [Rhizophagus irregularis]CAB5382469.1 unnamed protein product [Rhizophagus irregularis]